MNPDPLPWLSANAAALAVVFARAAGLAWTAPVLAAPELGPRMRLVIALALALVVAPAALAVGADPPDLNRPDWAAAGRACAAEVLVGATLGWTAALVIAGARQAGDLVAAQAGLSSAALYDPAAGEDVTALGHLYGLVAMGVFLALDGPLALVGALAESYRVIPAGGPSGGPLTTDLARFAFGQVGGALALSLRAAAPAALALALAGLALALLGRAAPSFQRLAMALPLRSALGLFLVLLGLTAAAATFTDAWDAWPLPAFEAWSAGG